MVSMHIGGAEANDVVRVEEPSSAGQGVAPVSVAPSAAAGGVMPLVCNVVEVGTVVVVGFDEEDGNGPCSQLLAPTIFSLAGR